MFKRKIEKTIEEYINRKDHKILCINGARQVGKSFIIRYVCKKYYKNYVELNMADDYNGDQLFKNVNTIDKFYIQASTIAGEQMKIDERTIIFIDEIQIYPQLFTLLKKLREDNKYDYICSGSQLGIALSDTTLIPMGSIAKVEMFPMDFEEFLWANSVGENVIEYLRKCFENRETVDEATHNKILSLFKTYLYVGGLPDAVKAYVETKNVVNIKNVHSETKDFYGADASKYDEQHKLKIRNVYDMLSSNIENKVKRIQFVKIENNEDARYSKYENEFEYIISSGIALPTVAISEPKFPLVQSSSKKLIKLYINDVGILTYDLYRNNINAIIEDKTGVNLGAVYETVAAQELKCHGHDLYYYDRRKVGEVDFLVDDYNDLSVVPIEIKSGSDESNFRALPKLLNDKNYKIKNAYVLSNKSKIEEENKVVYMPIYLIMFF